MTRNNDLMRRTTAASPCLDSGVAGLQPERGALPAATSNAPDPPRLLTRGKRIAVPTARRLLLLTMA